MTAARTIIKTAIAAMMTKGHVDDGLLLGGFSDVIVAGRSVDVAAGKGVDVDVAVGCGDADHKPEATGMVMVWVWLQPLLSSTAESCPTTAST